MQAEGNDFFFYFLRRRLVFYFHFARNLRRPWGRGWITRVALSCVTAVALFFVFVFTQGPGSTQKTKTPDIHGTLSTLYFCSVFCTSFHEISEEHEVSSKEFLVEEFLKELFFLFSFCRSANVFAQSWRYPLSIRKERTQYTTKVFCYMYSLQVRFI